jgi:beta-galactosidase
LLPFLAGLAGVKPMIAGLPKDVEVMVRTDGSKKLWFLLNHGQEAVRISTGLKGVDLLASEAINDKLELASCGVAIIRTL